MDDGRYINDSKLNSKTATNAVWAVRGSGNGGAVHLAATGYYDEPGQVVKGDDGDIQAGVGITYLRFRDNGDGTLTDTMTGLVWMKAADCIDGTWADAVAQAQALGNGTCGLTDGSKPGDWRMPNRSEMQSLEDRMVNNEADFMNATYVWRSDAAFYRGPIFANFHGYAVTTGPRPRMRRIRRRRGRCSAAISASTTRRRATRASRSLSDESHCGNPRDSSVGLRCRK